MATSQFLALHLLLATARADRWDLLREGGAAWHNLQFGGEFSINVGDEHGTLFRWESPGFSSATSYLAGASLSKWPSAIMISGLVNDGTLSYDSLASTYLPWWPTARKDPRSRVTLRHLLSFTSGYYADGSASALCGFGVPPSDQFLVCAESLFNASTSWGYEPGTHWAYISTHLQVPPVRPSVSVRPSVRTCARPSLSIHESICACVRPSVHHSPLTGVAHPPLRPHACCASPVRGGDGRRGEWHRDRQAVRKVPLHAVQHDLHGLVPRQEPADGHGHRCAASIDRPH